MIGAKMATLKDGQRPSSNDEALKRAEVAEMGSDLRKIANLLE